MSGTMDAAALWEEYQRGWADALRYAAGNSESDPAPDEQQENLVLSHLGAAWNAFVLLPREHPADAGEFVGAIHVAQGIIACRVARRVDPQMWPCFRQPTGRERA